MKLFKTSFIIVSLILFTVCVSNLFSQENFINPDGSPAPGYVNPIVEPNPEGSIAEEEFSADNTPNVNRDPRVITDEYGSQTVNRAVNFGSGSSTRKVQVPFNAAWNQNFNGSCEMWVYPTDFSHGNTFIAKGNTSGTMGFYWGYSNVSGMYFRIGTTFYTSASYTLPINTWTHIGATWTGGPANFTVRFYKNGVLSATIGPTAANWNLSSHPLIIGGNNAFTGGYYEGLIDEVRWWDPQRSTTQIRYNRFVGLGDYYGANFSNALTASTHYTGLISSWTFNFSSPTAYDDISDHDGTYMGGCGVSTRLAGQPIPYNLALKCDGSGTNSYVKIPHNSSVFNQTGDGSFEAWIYLNATGHQPVFQKGTSLAATTFGVGVSASNKLYLNVGGHNYISGGTTFTTGKWYHVAVTWAGGANRTVRFYVNGNLDDTQTFNVAMPTNSNDAWIGRYYSTTRFNGYIDEVRIWDPRLTGNEIRNNMLISGKHLLPNSQLVGFWNFDAALVNHSAIAGVNGSFNTGSGNDCRLSGYSNETSSGAYNYTFDAHTTTINGSYVNQAYFKGKTGLPIPNPGYVQDTINVGWWNANVSNVRVLISIQHQYCNNIDIRLYAPNMTYRNISTDNGGASDNGYLTIFYDGHSQPVTSSSFLSPWSNYVKPEYTMGNFGGSPVVGNWILRVYDDAAGNSGTLMGWGLRFNSATTTVSSISSNVPGEYKLHQNYPNPFNPVTNINFDIPKDGLVSIKVYDITGKEISTLVNQSVQAGSYNIEFDASSYSSGTYFYKITSGDFSDVKKMLLIK